MALQVYRHIISRRIKFVAGSTCKHVCRMEITACCWYEGDKEWSCLDHAIVQILVVVASRQVRTLSTDVRKGFDAIVLSIEWADLKTSPKGSKGSCLLLAASIGRKGNRLKSLCMVRGSVATLGSVWICRGDSNKHYEGSSDPMQSFLFCIKATVVWLWVKLWLHQNRDCGVWFDQRSKHFSLLAWIGDWFFLDLLEG